MALLTLSTLSAGRYLISTSYPASSKGIIHFSLKLTSFDPMTGTIKLSPFLSPVKKSSFAASKIYLLSPCTAFAAAPLLLINSGILSLTISESNTNAPNFSLSGLTTRVDLPDAGKPITNSSLCSFFIAPSKRYLPSLPRTAEPLARKSFFIFSLN